MKKSLSRFLAGFLAALCVVGLCTAAFAASGTVSFSTVNILLNGSKVGSKGESYVLGNGAQAPYSLSYIDEKGGATTYLPIRKISELLGIGIDWDGAASNVLISTKPAASKTYTGGTGAALKGNTVKITEEKSGDKLVIYTLENVNGMKVKVLNLGADTWAIEVPDKDGNFVDVVLDRADPVKNGAMGAVIGRNANRIGGAKFTLNGKTYELEKNNGRNNGGPLINNLHSGTGNLASKYYTGEIKKYDNISVLELSFKADAGADLLPGDINVKVTYALTDDNKLVINYWGMSNEDTIMNMTNHAYFNLAGHGSGNIFKQELWLNADYYTPVADDSIPTGEIAAVAGTPMDFTKSKPIYGKDTPLPTDNQPVRSNMKSGFDQIDWFDGYDNNWVLNGTGYRKAATLYDPASGRAMDVFTDTPGVQVFTANGTRIGADIAKDGAVYAPYCGIALETQFYPDAINKPWFPSPIVRAGEEYSSTTTFQFYIK